MQKGSPTLVSISGVIGVGKSVLLRLLSEHLPSLMESEGISLVFVKEPSELWREKKWTTRFYSDPKKRALAFQLLVFTTHVAAVREAIKQKEKELKESKEQKRIICIVERCMWDQLLFWKIQGVDSMEDDAYMQTWRLWNEFIPPVSKIFFCKTSQLGQTMERVALRASMIEEEKEGVTLEYQTRLYEKHCEWYTEGKTNISWKEDDEKTCFERGVDCVHLNTDIPYHTNEAALRELLCEFAEELKN
jgi:deoxyadenosine/deoxycytidine kinase